MLTNNTHSERIIKAENGKMHGFFKEWRGDDGLMRRGPINANGCFHNGVFIDLYLNDWSYQLELIPDASEACYGEMPRISYATRDKEDMVDFLTNLRDALSCILEIHDAI